MKLSTTCAAVFLAAGMACSAMAGAASLNPDTYLMSQSVLTKMKAAEADLARAGHKSDGRDDDEDDDKDDPTVEEVMRMIDSDKAVKAVLAKHGLTSRDYALTSFAMLHAGFFVMMESAMDKKKAAELMATYTKEQRANIALVRTIKK